MSIFGILPRSIARIPASVFRDGRLLVLHDSGDVLEDEQLLRDDVPVPDIAVVDVHEIRLV